MKKGVIGLIVVALAVIVAVVVFVWPSMQLKSALRTALPQISGVEKADFQSASYSVLSHKMVINGLALKFKPGQPIQEYNIASIEGSGVPLKVVLGLLKSDDTLFAGNFKLFDTLDVKGISYKAKDENTEMVMSEAHSRITNLSFASAGAPPKDFNSPEFMVWAIKSMKYEASEDKDINVVITAPQEKMTISFKVAQGNTTGYDNLRLKALDLKDLSMAVDFEKKDAEEGQNPKGQFTAKMANIKLSDLDFTRLADILAVASTGDETAMEQYLSNTNMFLPFYGYGQASAGPVEMALDGKTLAKIESIAGNGPVVAGQFPPNVTSTAKGVVIDLTQAPITAEDWEETEFLKALKAMNYTTIKFDVEAEMAYSAQDKTLDLKRYSFNFPEAFKLDLSLKLASFNPGDQKSSMMEVAMGLIGMGLENTKISLTDQGLAARLTPYLSKTLLNSDDPKAIVKKAATELDKAAPALNQLLSNGPAVAAEIKAFLNDPRQLVITSGNKEPLPVMAFSQMEGLGILGALKPNLTINDRAPVEIGLPAAAISMPQSGQEEEIFEEDVIGD